MTPVGPACAGQAFREETLGSPAGTGAGAEGRVGGRAHLRLTRWGRPVAFGLTTVLLGIAVWLFVATAIEVAARGDLWIDYVFYRDVGQRWLETGVYYLPHQLAGPYHVTLMVDVLYPPAALVLFVPFVWLPWVLWWAIPLGVLGYVVATYRPAPWALAVIVLCVAWPRTVGAVLFGNTDMWVAAGVAAGLRWGWPAALIGLKPIFLPFALVGVRHRSTWVAGAILGLVSLPMAGDYITAMQNVRIDAIGYSAGSLPFALIPVVAWLGRSLRDSSSTAR